MNLAKNQGFPLKDVTIKDAYMRNAFDKEVLYLCAFDTERLLAGFRETAGVSVRGALRYPGWESMLIGGHTLGHYMTACVNAAESANCKEEDRGKLVLIIQRLIDGLQECQEASGNGFLFGAQRMDKENPEQQFDMVEDNRTNILTKAKKHLMAAQAFDEVELFEKVYLAKTGENVLNNHHANTTIPKFMGALKRYVVTGEEIYYRYALKFWELVTGHHTYVTGGNSE